MNSAGHPQSGGRAAVVDLSAYRVERETARLMRGRAKWKTALAKFRSVFEEPEPDDGPEAA